MISGSLESAKFELTAKPELLDFFKKYGMKGLYAKYSKIAEESGGGARVESIESPAQASMFDSPHTACGIGGEEAAFLTLQSADDLRDLIQKITPITDPIVEAFKLSSEENDPAKTLEFITRFLDSPAGTGFNQNPDGGPGIFVYDAKRPLCGLMPFGFEAAERIEELLEPDHGDLIVLQARKNAPFAGGSTPLGDLRKALHWEAVKSGIKEAPSGFDFLWVVDFPLFSPTTENEPGQGGAAGLASTHHPFTAPKSAADVDLLLTDPAAVVADHYDLVVNGVELGGGSRRIHNAAMQDFVMREVLKMSDERRKDFAHLLEALRAGCPPHAGIALGLDRLIAVMLGKYSVRDVMAFPKSGKGEDLMVKSPTKMTEEQMQTYHLRLRE